MSARTSPRFNVQNNGTKLSIMDSDQENEDADVGPVLHYKEEGMEQEVLLNLNAYRKMGMWCDVVLEVGGREFFAHRAVLACISPYFSDLFDSPSAAISQQKRVGIVSRQRTSSFCQLDPLTRHVIVGDSQVDPVLFEAILSFLYTGVLDVPVDGVLKACELCTQLGLAKAVTVCSQFLIENLSAENALSLRSFANKSEHMALTKSTDEFIQNNFHRVVESREFSPLPKINIDVLYSMRMCFSENESYASLCDMALNWARHNLQSYEMLADMTEHVHVLYLDSNNLGCASSKLQDFKETAGDANFCSRVAFAESDPILKEYRRVCRDRKINTRGRIRRVEQQEVLQYCSTELPNSKKPLNGETEKRDFEQEWTVVAFENVSESEGENIQLVSIVKMNSTLVFLSMNVRAVSSDESTEDDILANDPTSINSPLTSGTDSDENGRSPVGQFGRMRKISSNKEEVSLKRIAPLVPARCSYGMGAVGDKVVLCGGFMRDECLDEFVYLDAAKNVWTSLPHMKAPRGRFDIAVDGDDFYIAGGSTGNEELRSIEKFSFQTMQWTSLPDMSKRRVYPGVAFVNGKLYVMGGKKRNVVRQCDALDVNTLEMVSVQKMPKPRSQASVVGVGDIVYVMGGCDDWVCSNECFAYHTTSDQWKTLNCMATSRRGAGIRHYAGKIFVAGGSDGLNCLNTVEVYDIATNSWSSLAPMTVPRCNIAIGLFSDRWLIVVGGFSGKVFAESAEVLDIWSPEMWSPYIPPELYQPSTCSTNSTNSLHS